LLLLTQAQSGKNWLRPNKGEKFICFLMIQS